MQNEAGQPQLHRGHRKEGVVSEDTECIWDFV